jgi:hypothetical protein
MEAAVGLPKGRGKLYGECAGRDECALSFDGLEVHELKAKGWEDGGQFAGCAPGVVT